MTAVLSDEARPMGFPEYMQILRRAVDDAELAYQSVVEGADAREDMLAAFGDAGIAVALASSKGLADALTLERAARGEFDTDRLSDADLMAAIAADVDAGLSDMGADPVAEPDRDAHCMRDVAAAYGDLLMSPPEADSVWPEAHDLLLPNRDDYQPKFPIDPDEEVGW
ncbi:MULTISPECIES: hypothetical protein [unclassified Nocardiopsis]|uniref:hypothetical protein n=1 Tax=Nocardiopsis TaxID=2013 RepID=UPI00387B3722